MKVLQLTVHLFPNIGGVETHLNDLFNSLIKKGWKVFVLAYQPLSTKTHWQIIERSKNLTILRIPWLKGFFERLVHHPILEFIYLVPGLFLVTPFIIFFYKPNIIHAHGICAAVSAVFWGKLFEVKTVISIHSIYTFPKKGLYRDFVKLIFGKSDLVLCLSKKSKEEIENLGIAKDKVRVFTYWVDLQKFKQILYAREKTGWTDKFIVLFVGRLIKEKGIDSLLASAASWGHAIHLAVIGTGPMEKDILKQVKKYTNISYLGRINQSNLPIYYSSADCLIVPSTSEEGFGRVIIESLACGTPVLAANRGAISEAMDETVGKFIEINADSIEKAVEYFYNNSNELKKLSMKARRFTERRYSESNVQTIIKAYKE